jgi:hypothetical protein
MPAGTIRASAAAALIVLLSGAAARAADKPAPPAQTEVSAPDPVEAKKIRRMAAAGYTITYLGAATMIASWISYMPDVGSKIGDLSIPWYVIMSSWAGLSAIGIPLLQAVSFKARKLLGLPPVDGFFIAGWFFLGIAYASNVLVDKNPVYTMLYASIGYAAASLWCSWGAGRSLRSLGRAERAAREASSAIIAPWATALPGGAMAGIAGVF